MSCHPGVPGRRAHHGLWSSASWPGGAPWCRSWRPPRRCGRGRRGTAGFGAGPQGGGRRRPQPQPTLGSGPLRGGAEPEPSPGAPLGLPGARDCRPQAAPTARTAVVGKANGRHDVPGLLASLRGSFSSFEIKGVEARTAMGLAGCSQACTGVQDPPHPGGPAKVGGWGAASRVQSIYRLG